MSNLDGTSIMEINFVTWVAPSSWLCRHTIMSSLPSNLNASCIFLLDFALLVIPMLLSFTLADYVSLIIALQATISLGLIAFGHHRKESYASHLQRLNEQRKVFLTEFRTATILFTCIAILAVDFVIFPRRFAKTETFGTGLMDVGVGSFIVLNALSSKQARVGRSPSARLQISICTRARAVVPILALGFLRLVSIKATDYQEHVSEYGTHWNFFFTLACVAFLSDIVLRCFPSVTAGVIGLAIISAYQIGLALGLSEYILFHPRDTFIHANKEGLCSSFGYLAIYLVSLEIGYVLNQARTIAQWRLFAFRFSLGVVVLWLLTSISNVCIQPISRRMVNMSYFLWIIAINLTIILGFLLVHLLLRSFRIKVVDSALTRVINSELLPVFLLANVLTGLVNLSMQTLYVERTTAFAVMLIYLLVVCGLPWSVDYIFRKSFNIR